MHHANATARSDEQRSSGSFQQRKAGTERQRKPRDGAASNDSDQMASGPAGTGRLRRASDCTGSRYSSHEMSSARTRTPSPSGAAVSATAASNTVHMQDNRRRSHGSHQPSDITHTSRVWTGSKVPAFDATSHSSHRHGKLPGIGPCSLQEEDVDEILNGKQGLKGSVEEEGASATESDDGGEKEVEEDETSWHAGEQSTGSSRSSSPAAGAEPSPATPAATSYGMGLFASIIQFLVTFLLQRLQLTVNNVHISFKVRCLPELCVGSGRMCVFSWRAQPCELCLLECAFEQKSKQEGPAPAEIDKYPLDSRLETSCCLILGRLIRL